MENKKLSTINSQFSIEQSTATSQLPKRDGLSLPKSWQIKKFSEVCRFVRGPFGGSLKKSIFKETGYAVYEQKHAIYNRFDNIRYFVDEEKFDEMKRFELNSGDLIMSCSGTIGKIAIVPENIKKGIINQALLILSPKKLLSNVFLKLWMQSENFQESLSKFSKGAAIKNIASVKVLKNIKIPLPSIKEQKRIVAILDRAFEAIDQAKANAEQNLKNAKELFQSKLQAIFDNGKLKVENGEWEEKTLGEVCEIRSGRDYKKIINPNGKYPILGSAGKPMGYTNEYICEEGTTIIGRKGTINSPMFIETKFWNVDTAFGFHALDKLDKKFLFLFCKNFDFTDLDKGSGRPSLVKKDLLIVKISFPSVKEQKQIVQELDALQAETKKLEEIYQKKMEDLEELKKSVLQKAFNGEL